MYSEKMSIPECMNMGCFEVHVDFDGEIEFKYTNDTRVHYFTTDELTEICRLLDNVEFHKLIDAHNECADSYVHYGDLFGDLIADQRLLSSDKFYDRLNEFDRAVERRVTLKSVRENAHAEWRLKCEIALPYIGIDFDLFCEIASHMLHIDYYMLALA